MKFGGSVVEAPGAFDRIAGQVLEASREFPEVVIVVSAMHDWTDRLIGLAHEVHPDPPKREYDMLVSVGERISSALLAMALSKRGAEAVSFTGSQAGILTSEAHGEARIRGVRPHRLEEALSEKKFPIVAGFQGVSEGREITTLGRGGSDTTAVALGVALGAERVVFVKDVPGMFTADPKKEPTAELIPCLSYGEALRLIAISGEVIHPHALELAAQNSLELWVGEGSKIA